MRCPDARAILLQVTKSSWMNRMQIKMEVKINAQSADRMCRKSKIRKAKHHLRINCNATTIPSYQKEEIVSPQRIEWFAELAIRRSIKSSENSTKRSNNEDLADGLSRGTTGCRGELPNRERCRWISKVSGCGGPVVQA